MSDMQAIEMRLAYEWAAEQIELYCVAKPHEDELENGWWDLTSSDEDLTDAAAYLESRRLLVRHPDHPQWVTICDEGEPWCAHCGPDCLGGAAHHARAEDGVLFGSLDRANAGTSEEFCAGKPELLHVRLHRMEEQQKLIFQEIRTMASTIVTRDQFDEALANLLTAEAARDAAVTQALTDLQAKVAAGAAIRDRFVFEHYACRTEAYR